MISSLDIAFNANLRKRLEDFLAEKLEQLANGSPSDWANYRQEVGVCHGVKYALEVSEDLRKEMTGAR